MHIPANCTIHACCKRPCKNYWQRRPEKTKRRVSLCTVDTTPDRKLLLITAWGRACGAFCKAPLRLACTDASAEAIQSPQTWWKCTPMRDSDATRRLAPLDLQNARSCIAHLDSP